MLQRQNVACHLVVKIVECNSAIPSLLTGCLKQIKRDISQILWRLFQFLLKLASSFPAQRCISDPNCARFRLQFDNKLYC